MNALPEIRREDALALGVALLPELRKARAPGRAATRKRRQAS